MAPNKSLPDFLPYDDLKLERNALKAEHNELVSDQCAHWEQEKSILAQSVQVMDEQIEKLGANKIFSHFEGAIAALTEQKELLEARLKDIEAIVQGLEKSLDAEAPRAPIKASQPATAKKTPRKAPVTKSPELPTEQPEIDEAGSSSKPELTAPVVATDNWSTTDMNKAVANIESLGQAMEKNWPRKEIERCLRFAMLDPNLAVSFLDNGIPKTRLRREFRELVDPYNLTAPRNGKSAPQPKPQQPRPKRASKPKATPAPAPTPASPKPAPKPAPKSAKPAAKPPARGNFDSAEKLALFTSVQKFAPAHGQKGFWAKVSKEMGVVHGVHRSEASVKLEWLRRGAFENAYDERSASFVTDAAGRETLRRCLPAAAGGKRGRGEEEVERPSVASLAKKQKVAVEERESEVEWAPPISLVQGISEDVYDTSIPEVENFGMNFGFEGVGGEAGFAEEAFAAGAVAGDSSPVDVESWPF